MSKILIADDDKKIAAIYEYAGRLEISSETV